MSLTFPKEPRYIRYFTSPFSNQQSAPQPPPLHRLCHSHQLWNGTRCRNPLSLTVGTTSPIFNYWLLGTSDPKRRPHGKIMTGYVNNSQVSILRTRCFSGWEEMLRLHGGPTQEDQGQFRDNNSKPSRCRLSWQMGRADRCGATTNSHFISFQLYFVIPFH